MKVIFSALCAIAFWFGIAHAQLAGGLIFPGPGTPAASGGGSAMTTPLLSLAGVGASNANLTSYHYIAYGRAGGTGNVFTEPPRQIPFPIPGTINQLTANFPSGSGSGTWQVTLRKNGSATGLTCTTPTSATPATCTNNTSVSVAVGDLLVWSITSAGSPTAAGSGPQLSAVFTSTNNNEGFLLAGGASTAAVNSSASYTGFGGATGYNTTTEAIVSSLLPTAGTIDNLNVSTDTLPGAGNQYVATFYKNGAATALTCTVTNAALTCSTSGGANAVAVVATDTVSVQFCPGTHSGSGGSCTAASTATTGHYHASVRWVPTVAGETIASQVQTIGADTVGTEANYFNGASDSTNVETDVCNIVSVGMTVKKEFVSQSTAPGGASTRTLALRKGTCAVNTSQALTCTVASGATACNDTTHTVAFSASDFIDWLTTTSGANAAQTWFKASAVVTVP